jgi:hypothetical protein
MPKFSQPTSWLLILGSGLLVLGLVGRSWIGGIAGVAVCAAAGWRSYSQSPTTALREPWPWPADFRKIAGALARPIDPTPQRIVSAHEKSSEVAEVATTKETLARLIAEKPAAWDWAVFTSVLVQRRNSVQGRLRKVAAGYQPSTGRVAMSSRDYSTLAHAVCGAVADLGIQTNQFLLSPAMTGAFEGSPDTDAIVSAAERLMDYHKGFLEQAETCLQTAVDGEAGDFVEDMWALTLSPLVGFERLIATLCQRIGEAQELLPYAGGAPIAFDEVEMDTTPPDGDLLLKRLLAHMKRFDA